MTLIPPVWVVVALLGGIAASLYAVVWPPRLPRFLTQLVAGLAGAGLGQLLGDSAGFGDQLIGDAHVVGVTVGALLAVLVVRRLAP